MGKYESKGCVDRKHNYEQRLEDINGTIGMLLKDFIKEHQLEVGGLYRVYTSDGKSFKGFFDRLNVGSYSSTVNIYCYFYKVKKDFTPSKVREGKFIRNINSIKRLPF